MKKLDNPARNSLENWLHGNAELLIRAEFDMYNHVLMYSVAGHPLLVLDMYSKTDGTYQGFEVFTQVGGNDVSEAIDILEQLD